MIELFLPRLCPYCGARMLPSEAMVCMACLPQLPRLDSVLHGNAMERRLAGRFPFQHAAAFCYYTSHSPIGQSIRGAKYHDRPWLNADMARLFAHELDLALPTDGSPGWPFDIDVILPIPLHRWRLFWREYNQSLPIAEALASHWQLPLDTSSLVKARFTQTQVGRTKSQRYAQEAGTFTVRHPGRLAHRHVLIVDDVLTTGSTITAAADALIQAVPGVRISVLTLAMAR